MINNSSNVRETKPHQVLFPSTRDPEQHTRLQFLLVTLKFFSCHYLPCVRPSHDKGAIDGLRLTIFEVSQWYPVCELSAFMRPITEVDVRSVDRFAIW